jgi:hypothetical protein
MAEARYQDEFDQPQRADAFEGTCIGPPTAPCIIIRRGGRTRAQGKLDQGATFLLFAATQAARKLM